MSNNTDIQLERLANELTQFINDLDQYIHENKERTNNLEDKYQNNMTKCRFIRDKKGNERIACVHIEPPENNPENKIREMKKDKDKGKSKSKSKSKNKSKNKNKSKSKNKSKDRSRLADKPIHKKIINGQVMAPWGDKWLPVCDGWGFPYVEGCYSDASNWSVGPKQCIIENPGTSNLASGSLYTCGFLW